MAPKIKKRHLLDYSILIPYLTLCIVGLMMVYSSTSYEQVTSGNSPLYYVKMQTIYWVISLILIVVIYKMKLSVLQNPRFTKLAMVIMFGLLLAVFVFPRVNGAFGWIKIPGMGTIQPVEFLKIVIVWYLASVLAHRQSDIQKDFVKSVMGPVGFAFGLSLIPALYPDFGNVAILFLLIFVMLFSSGINYLYTLFIGVGGIIFSTLVIWFVNLTNGKFLPSHVAPRFAVYRNPFTDEFNAGHQMVNGYYAMFNGGLLGRGLGNSLQKRGYLKFASTDFIFAVVVEELGLIGSVAILGILFYLVTRIVLVGIRSKDAFNSMMCLGIASLFLIQIFINLGGLTGIIPLTGITFPFLSQGGSSLLILSVAVGFALNISADEKRKKYQLY